MTSKGKVLKTDIVVIGGGGAGLAAAIAAAEAGAHVILLEKHGLGGNSALAFGLFGAESPTQKRLNIDCSKDELFKQAMEFAHWRINPRLVRAIIDKSSDTIRWLEEKGLDFDCIPYFHDPGQNVPTWHVPDGGGAEIIKVLGRNCEDLGVQLFKQTPAKKILTSPDVKITGVSAKSKGEDLTIKTKSAIIATGGFGGNKTLLKKYCPDYRDHMVCFGLLHKGDGLMMANKIGAANEGLGLLQLSGPITLGNIDLDIGSPENKRKVTLYFSIVFESTTIWLNKMGKRFIDESICHDHHLSSHAVARQPESICYTVFDDKVMQKMAAEKQDPELNLKNFRGGPRRLKGKEAEAIKDPLRVFDSWDKLARWMEADPKVLNDTINEYNASCDQGHDPLFSKERDHLQPLRTPPYYAVRWYPTFPNTAGGIKINEHTEVLDKQDNAIPGIYAAGMDTGGWVSETYFIKLSGYAFGYAVNSGRIAGENAAKFVRSP